jgi:two-component system LytT family sensor kinase
MFNALAAIQNLMNKHDVEGANKYLAKFARLTRSVLDDSNADMISISSEIALLEDYLQMEQLRFGFKYDIYVDEEIDKANIEIPAMLLQPFIENAVKHGVSKLKNDGLISISFTKEGNKLILKVTDNGKGFDVQQANGKGIMFSKSRINLFNSINKFVKVELKISTDANGTLIIIELLNVV